MAKVVRKVPTHRRTDRGNASHAEQRHWYFERRISMDTIVGLIGIAVVLGGPFVLWGRAMESAQMQTNTRVQLLETVSEQRANFDRERQKELSAKVDSLDQKVTASQVKISEQVQALQISIGLLNSKPR